MKTSFPLLQIVEMRPDLDQICTNCKMRIQYSFKLREDIITNNERLLTEDGLELAKVEVCEEAAQATEVYQIMDLGGNQSTQRDFSLYDADENSVQLEFLDVGGTIYEAAEGNSDEDEGTYDPDTSEIEIAEESPSSVKPENIDATEDNQDAVR